MVTAAVRTIEEKPRTEQERAYLVAELGPRAIRFQPKEAVRRYLGGMAIWVVSGPSGCGKGYGLNGLEEIASDRGPIINRVKPTTTRIARGDEVWGKDSYAEHPDIASLAVRRRLEALLDVDPDAPMECDDIAQVIVHPSRELYWTDVSGYDPNKTNVVELTYDESHRLLATGAIPGQRTIYIVPYDGPTWLERLRERSNGQLPWDFKERLDEGLGGLVLARAARWPRHAVVLNKYDDHFPDVLASVLLGAHSEAQHQEAIAAIDPLAHFMRGLQAHGDVASNTESV